MFELYRETNTTIINNLQEELCRVKNELNSSYSIIQVINTKVEEILESTKNRTSSNIVY